MNIPGLQRKIVGIEKMISPKRDVLNINDNVIKDSAAEYFDVEDFLENLKNEKIKDAKEALGLLYKNKTFVGKIPQSMMYFCLHQTIKNKEQEKTTDGRSSILACIEQASFLHRMYRNFLSTAKDDKEKTAKEEKFWENGMMVLKALEKKIPLDTKDALISLMREISSMENFIEVKEKENTLIFCAPKEVDEEDKVDFYIFCMKKGANKEFVDRLGIYNLFSITENTEKIELTQLTTDPNLPVGAIKIETDAILTLDDLIPGKINVFSLFSQNQMVPENVNMADRKIDKRAIAYAKMIDHAKDILDSSFRDTPTPSWVKRVDVRYARANPGRGMIDKTIAKFGFV
ncbi:hypothetical protein HYV44_03530 [Candidatus Microgenomates bacterium]|nr:hypothetical protein [Candidatus Microgenomates bacterium]